MSHISPWLVLAGLGAFHGLNPAMGWLFAVALGLHRQSRWIVLKSLIPIAIGHTVSIGIVALAVVTLGLVVDQRFLEIGAGVVLLGWATHHAVYGHRHRVRIGMTTGIAGLGVWSFLMATAHGAGLMLVPVLVPLCLSATPAAELTAAGSLPIAMAAIGVHMAAMLAVILAIAVLVYEWLDLSFLRRGWINFDHLWIGALVITGIILVV
jgi:hypothetical protein